MKNRNQDRKKCQNHSYFKTCAANASDGTKEKQQVPLADIQFYLYFFFVCFYVNVTRNNDYNQQELSIRKKLCRLFLLGIN